MNKIERMRREKGFTQYDVAKAVGVHQSAVSQWEGGDTMPRAATLKKLAEVLDCTIDELVGR